MIPPSSPSSAVIGLGPKVQPRSESSGEGASFRELLLEILDARLEAVRCDADQDDAAGLQRAAAVDRAQIFNEFGLMQGPVPAPHLPTAAKEGPMPQLGARRVVIAALPQAPPTAVYPALDADAAAPASLSAHMPDGSRGNPGRSNAGAVPAAPRSAARSPAQTPGGHPSSPASPPPSSDAPAGSEPVEARTSASRCAQHVTELLADGGAVGIQVSLDAADQGLRVIARLEKLTREQRETLCQEMVELLAAHGFPATEISLNGETLLGRPGQKEPR